MKISKEMLNGFQSRVRLFGHHNKTCNKSIDMIADPETKAIWFELKNYGSMMFAGPDLDEAIDIFNKISN